MKESPHLSTMKPDIVISDMDGKFITPQPSKKFSRLAIDFDPEEDMRMKLVVDGTLDKLLHFVGKDDFTARKLRNITLAPNVFDPYIGILVVKRIMCGVIVLDSIYDPFTRLEDHKLNMLIKYLKTDLDNPFDTSHGGVYST